jgi:hypothetical protein
LEHVVAVDRDLDRVGLCVQLNGGPRVRVDIVRGPAAAPARLAAMPTRPEPAARSITRRPATISR